jgi:SAM-dependent methyltransferase
MRSWSGANYPRQAYGLAFDHLAALNDLERREPSNLLEIGCANGAFLAAAGALGHRPTGIDFVPESVAEARAQGLDAHVGDVRAISRLKPGRRFDTIAMFQIIEHLEDPNAVFADIAEVAAPGARIYIGCPSATALLAAHHQCGNPRRNGLLGLAPVAHAPLDGRGVPGVPAASRMGRAVHRARAASHARRGGPPHRHRRNGPWLVHAAGPPAPGDRAAPGSGRPQAAPGPEAAHRAPGPRDRRPVLGAAGEIPGWAQVDGLEVCAVLALTRPRAPLPTHAEAAMPQGWSKHDNQMYESIRESSMDRGMDPAQAKEIAARTVNKHRRQEGRTPNKRTMGTGNPRKPLEEHTRDELYNLAKERKIEGRSKMQKEELIAALNDA